MNNKKLDEPIVRVELKEIPIFGVSGVTSKMVTIEDPVQYLSFFDMDQVVGFISAKENNDKVELERILFENGADISKPYLLEYNTHRPRTSNLPYEGFRFVFSERLDLDWKQSGACSNEAYVFSKDRSLMEELRSLDPYKTKQKAYVEEEKEFEEDVVSSDELDIRGGE